MTRPRPGQGQASLIQTHRAKILTLETRTCPRATIRQVTFKIFWVSNMATRIFFEHMFWALSACGLLKPTVDDWNTPSLTSPVVWSPCRWYLGPQSPRDRRTGECTRVLRLWRCAWLQPVLNKWQPCIGIDKTKKFFDISNQWTNKTRQSTPRIAKTQQLHG